MIRPVKMLGGPDFSGKYGEPFPEFQGAVGGYGQRLGEGESTEVDPDAENLDVYGGGIEEYNNKRFTDRPPVPITADGEVNKFILDAQTWLNKMGIANLTLTGVMDEATKDAILTFQMTGIGNLTPTGVLDNDTYYTMEEAVTQKTPSDNSAISRVASNAAAMIGAQVDQQTVIAAALAAQAEQHMRTMAWVIGAIVVGGLWYYNSKKTAA